MADIVRPEWYEFRSQLMGQDYTEDDALDEAYWFGKAAAAAEVERLRAAAAGVEADLNESAELLLSAVHTMQRHQASASLGTPTVIAAGLQLNRILIRHHARLRGEAPDAD